MPQVVTDASDGRPHFKNRSASASQDSSAGLHIRLRAKPPASSNPPASDPDRPTLRKRADSSAPAASASSTDTPAPETPIGGADPDRPHMVHGQQNPTDADSQPAQLTGVPLGLQQMIAVSDAADRESHPFVYLWGDPTTPQR